MVQIQTCSLPCGRCISYGKSQFFIHEEFVFLHFFPQHPVKFLNYGARLQRAAFKDAILVGILFFPEFFFYPVQFSQFQDDFVTLILVYLTIGALYEFTTDMRPAELLRDAFLSLCIQPATVGYPAICN